MTAREMEKLKALLIEEVEKLAHHNFSSNPNQPNILVRLSDAIECIKRVMR